MDLVRIAAGLAVLVAGTAAGAAPEYKDPNRQICKSKPAIGSRLQRVRECHSAAEWEDLKRAERLGLQIKQFNGNESEGVNEMKMPDRAMPN